MAVVGCLGDIVFTVSSEFVRTLDNAQWSGSAQYAVHHRHATHALTEFTGLDPDKFTFDMVLGSALGTDPMEELTRLWKYERDGTAVPLTLGEHAYGKWRWVVVNHKAKIQAWDKFGNATMAKVSVSLQEYM